MAKPQTLDHERQSRDEKALGIHGHHDNHVNFPYHDNAQDNSRYHDNHDSAQHTR
jgi:hypothetical protein